MGLPGASGVRCFASTGFMSRGLIPRQRRTRGAEPMEWKERRRERCRQTDRISGYRGRCATPITRVGCRLTRLLSCQAGGLVGARRPAARARSRRAFPWRGKGPTLTLVSVSGGLRLPGEGERPSSRRRPTSIARITPSPARLPRLNPIVPRQPSPAGRWPPEPME